MFSESNPNQRPVPAAEHTNYALFLASFVARRRKLGLTIERAADLAGIKVSQWCDLEAGWVPVDRSVLRAVADTIEVNYVQVSFLAEVALYNQTDFI
jgi:hypothetical protein